MLTMAKAEEVEAKYTYEGKWHVHRDGWVDPLVLNVRSTMPAGVASRVVDFLARELVGNEGVAGVFMFELRFSAEGPDETGGDVVTQELTITNE